MTFELDCGVLWEKYDIPEDVSCCTEGSCHDEAGYGYHIALLEDGARVSYIVCCQVIEWIDTLDLEPMDDFMYPKLPKRTPPTALFSVDL